ncbi:MAG: 16S rRNA (guanine(527)-N(7))-methyltransferase RsmG [Pseudomonadota bacterium]
MTRDAFQSEFRVPRETLDKLDAYVALLLKWSRAINLVADADPENLWDRHIADSAQITHHLKKTPRTWLDFGSGAGLPGLVCHILLQSLGSKFTLVESDQRKAAFLREANRQLETEAKIVANRVEEVPTSIYDVVTARAVAPLRKLLPMAEKFASAQTQLLFLKGSTASKEIKDAREDWDFSLEQIPSITRPDARLLRVTNIRRLT